MSALELEGVAKYFGALAATQDVSFSVEVGERVALVGPNGAGKTTLFNLISGEIMPDKGVIRLSDQDVTRYSPDRMSESGLGRTFQKNSLFMESTVYENIRLAVQRRLGIRLKVFKSVDRYPELRRETEQVLNSVRLTSRSETKAKNLSYGEQRQVELGIALATSPRVLLLDEPTAGMSGKETGEMVTMLQTLPQDLTLLIVEHDMDVVMALASRIIVLNFGEVIADGDPEEVRRNKEVLAAYLGVGADEESLGA
jgi:branched-chain amino acid transport system ATP-binding protein